MAQDFLEVLDDLRKQDPASLTEDQIGFLRARRSYLSADEQTKFGLDEASASKAAALEDGYDKMKVADLVSLVKERNLSTTKNPKKDELVEVLRTDDAAKTADSDAEVPAA